MSTPNEKKVGRKIYFPQELVDRLNETSSGLDISATKFVEIATYHLIHCTPSERAAIIAKYFDPAWPPKDES
ncbi:MAG: hypothetical protein AB1656_04910 [Candidatus Omnitrophota bacterium]